MEFNKELESLKQKVEELRTIQNVLYDLEDRVMAIEKEINAIDDSLPSDKEIRKMDSRKRKDINKVLDILDEAYALTDQILGPADNPQTDSPAGTAFSPEARGNSEMKVEDITIGKKGWLS